MRLLDNRVIFGMLMVLGFAACKEPDGIGLDVLPDGEQMPIAWVDTFTLEARTISYDSVMTTGLGTHLIGDFGDPVLGRVQSQLFTQFTLSSAALELGPQFEVDSVILNLVYSGSYGHTDKLKGTMTFGVFELDQDLHEDSIYYSTSSLNTGTQLAVHTFRPELFNDVVIYDAVAGTDTIPPSLRIPLDDDLGQRILNSSSLASNEAFVEEFEGLNVRPMDAFRSPGTGSMLNFSLGSANTRLELYYHLTGEDSVRVEYFKVGSPSFTKFDHEYSAQILTALDDSTVAGATQLYIRSMAGLRMKIDIPHLRELSQLGAVAINKAELVVPLDNSASTEYGAPTSLQLLAVSDSGTSLFPIDFFEGDDYYGGGHNVGNSEYVFNIARHLQSLLNSPEKQNNGLYIVNSGNAVNARRAIFNGPQHPDRPMKLRMTYTIIE